MRFLRNAVLKIEDAVGLAEERDGEGGCESSVPDGGLSWVGNPEERNLLRGPLPLMECIVEGNDRD